MLTKFRLFEDLDESSAEYYIGVDLDNAISWCAGKPVPTPETNLYPLDWDVIKHSNDEARHWSEKQVEKWVKSVCGWYDGSIASIQGGLNVLGDFENAKGYGEFVLGIEVRGGICDFGSDYSFVKNANDCKVIFVYDVAENEFFEPTEFEHLNAARKFGI